MSKSKIMPSIEDVKHLQIPFQDISLATDGFADKNLIGKGGFGHVYKGISEKHGCIAVKRLVHRQGQGDHQFKIEIALLSEYEHENIVSLIGFCDEDGEKILVYKYESNGSLDRHLNNQDLTWIQRLHICLDAACGLQYLHDDVGPQRRIIHRDVKSANILLDEKWNAKISDFGLSRVGPANTQSSFFISNACGTTGYIDPYYFTNGYLTQNSDVYSFGVVLWEVLCGRLAHVMDEGVVLSILVQRRYRSGTLYSFIPSYLWNQINTASLNTFSNIAYQCLKSVEERPTMKQVVEQLQKALHNQLEVKKLEEEEAKPGDEKKGEDSKDLPQEIVLRTYMHCEDCARKVHQCLKGFEGVENVVTDCETHQVIVMGENADPFKVLERVQKEIHRKVEILSPVPNPHAEDPKKLLQGEPSNREETKDEIEVKKPEEGEKGEEEAKSTSEDEENQEDSKDSPPLYPPQEVVLSVFLHCKGCARKLRHRLKGFEGFEDVITDCKTQQVIVKGTKADPLKVLEIVQMESHEKVELISPVSKPLAEEPNKSEQEEPPIHGEKKDDVCCRIH